MTHLWVGGEGDAKAVHVALGARDTALSAAATTSGLVPRACDAACSR